MKSTPPSRLSGSDVIAGLSVALVLIPQSMAYAELAGLPPHHGLYAAGLPLIAAAFLASSPYLQTGRSHSPLTYLHCFRSLPREQPNTLSSRRFWPLLLE